MRLILLALISVSLFAGHMGSVTFLQGSADLKKEAETVAVVKGLGVDEKETLLTHEKSKVQVRLLDASIITVGPKSEYRFVAFNEADDPHALMQIKRGFFKAVTGRIGKVAPERFQVKTNEATIGVRGTWFMGYVEAGHEAIGCSKGAITVTTSEGVFDVMAGEMLLFEMGQWRIEPMDYKRFTPVLGGGGLEQLTDEILITVDEDLVEEVGLRHGQSRGPGCRHRGGLTESIAGGHEDLSEAGELEVL
ncbi:MAG: FecR family protein, partial [Sulfurimonadaceae bacterium]|nr:FecR family protein [Sulfurimonadaceae bacterium]